MENKYFKVTCKCGHVGTKHFIRISFPITAATGKGAAEIARYIPRVKHDHKDAILDCKEISFEQYKELQQINHNDPYLCCENRQEQQMIEDFSERLEIEPRYIKEIKKNKRESIEYRIKKQAIKEKEKWWLWEEEEDFIYEQFAY